LPEKRLNNLYRNVLAQIFKTAHGDVLYYGSQPGGYDGCLFGVEEGYAMLALTMSGFHADAQRYMDGTYLTREFLNKVEVYEKYEHRHQQYRNGLQPMYAIEAYRFSRDRKWIQKHLELFNDCADWTISNRRKTMQLEHGQKPPQWGLLPKWSYGGDLANQQCYPLFPNFACWRGLYTTAELLSELGDTTRAQRYLKEASDYRAVIVDVVDRIYRSDARPPFLPMHVEATAPDGGEYYQLFAGCDNDLQFFEFADKRANYLSDFLEQDNRTFCSMPRFRVDLGSGGLDGIYGLGIVLTKLHQDKIREFLLGFYAFQAFNMEHTCFGSRESNPIYASDLHLRELYPNAAVCDPLACSSVVCLLFLRHLLVTEETQGAAQYTGNLLLLFGAPSRWFRDGETIRVEDAPTHFGKISYSVASCANADVIEARLNFAEQSDCKAVKLRLRHPDGKRLVSVSINRQRHSDFDAGKELITIECPAGNYTVEAKYS
jgi:hypothetical protein